jgi:FkbM family methyltransferase
MRALLRPLFVWPVRGYFRYGPKAGRRVLWKVADHTWWLERNSMRTRTADGAILEVNGRDIVGRYISYFGEWEPNLTAWLRQTLQLGDTFIDVGANIGYFTVLASKLVGETGRVVAIEAIPETTAILRRNVERRQRANVRVVNSAVWYERGSISMFCSDLPTGTATADATAAERWTLKNSIEVPAETLPMILTGEELATARVIKIDVEGAELAVVQGLVDALDGCRPDVQIVLESDVRRPAWGEIVRLLGSRGFSYEFIENDYSAHAYYTRDPDAAPVFLDAPPEGVAMIDAIFTR